VDTKASVFAGQILAEMLAGICHEEFYRYSDQEVKSLFPSSPSTVLSHFPFNLSSRLCQILIWIVFRNIHHAHLIPTVSRFLPQGISEIPPRHRLRPSRN
jgi:hypothetical protein